MKIFSLPIPKKKIRYSKCYFGRMLGPIILFRIRVNIQKRFSYQFLWASRFLDRTDLTSVTNRRASNTGNKLSSAVSLGSLNQLLIGMALSKKQSITFNLELSTLDISLIFSFLRSQLWVSHDVFTWVSSVCPWWIIKNEYGWQIGTNGR